MTAPGLDSSHSLRVASHAKNASHASSDDEGLGNSAALDVAFDDAVVTGQTSLASQHSEEEFVSKKLGIKKENVFITRESTNEELPCVELVVNLKGGRFGTQQILPSKRAVKELSPEEARSPLKGGSLPAVMEAQLYTGDGQVKKTTLVLSYVFEKAVDEQDDSGIASEDSAVATAKTVLLPVMPATGISISEAIRATPSSKKSSIPLLGLESALIKTEASLDSLERYFALNVLASGIRISIGLIQVLFGLFYGIGIFIHRHREKVDISDDYNSFTHLQHGIGNVARGILAAIPGVSLVFLEQYDKLEPGSIIPLESTLPTEEEKVYNDQFTIRYIAPGLKSHNKVLSSIQGYKTKISNVLTEAFRKYKALEGNKEKSPIDFRKEIEQTNPNDLESKFGKDLADLVQSKWFQNYLNGKRVLEDAFAKYLSGDDWLKSYTNSKAVIERAYNEYKSKNENEDKSRKDFKKEIKATGSADLERKFGKELAELIQGDWYQTYLKGKAIVKQAFKDHRNTDESLQDFLKRVSKTSADQLEEMFGKELAELVKSNWLQIYLGGEKAIKKAFERYKKQEKTLSEFLVEVSKTPERDLESKFGEKLAELVQSGWLRKYLNRKTATLTDGLSELMNSTKTNSFVNTSWRAFARAREFSFRRMRYTLEKKSPLVRAAYFYSRDFRTHTHLVPVLKGTVDALDDYFLSETKQTPAYN